MAVNIQSAALPGLKNREAMLQKFFGILTGHPSLSSNIAVYPVLRRGDFAFDAGERITF